MKDQITNKVSDGTYTFEEVSCPVCGGSTKEVIGKKDRYGLYFETNLCSDCGLIYTSPRMDQTSYNEFYNAEYRKLYDANNTATETFFLDQQKRGESLYNYLDEHQLIQKKNMFVVEVGCGAGGILKVFKEKGHTIKGIDLGEDYINWGKKNYDLDLEMGTINDFSFEDQKPDLVIYSHVMEHILDLDKELELLKERLHKDSLVYIEVPGVKEVHRNYKSDFLLYLQNAHTIHFTLETLKNLFTKNGFKMICGNQFVRSVFKIGNSDTTIVNDYNSVKKYLLKIERIHKFYPFTTTAWINTLKIFYRKLKSFQ
ncbi:methyltransferase domain-containing protein [Flammeovirga sp. SJP92]|uniref:methyltransferase domain-containing protein n=1 Tax=Flammeovirga sp. SJP92 TaxID=1775430 RepID=UPI001560AB25|nr:methyltransferase domain-containing protein [Flammeovirga sp. SJP92]